MAARRMNCRYLRIVHSHQPKTESTQFVYMSHQPGHEQERVVFAHNEGRWTFSEHGPALAFEQTGTSAATRKKDRPTLDLLITYCRELGIDLTNPGFFAGRCALIDTRHFPIQLN